ncbi:MULTISPECIES: imidazoleglycerol-phosphate dehydratase HisB [unclassified Candidatus Frackibacter]|uniref:imidazoleglycerol-phosphate dehydratase HisB n=1 Tax=unclassified Candidatus Frackibacter TaxID=2648818 RepID=UPI0008904F06|nr:MULTISPECIES: imidazoleglycerol-phosphate dehydratase HisB [unclassified Candidatus Frackibacter]SDC51364.1 imidazoleglycerol-phosphate dehydratase [Candidatus Frackibacter sp. WG11]SEM40849.1 imidazoleglycerol-phosphate dehydratase [Candidatus Frackibacter sp. WG12]SFL75402.1 imidazoleglycerol-phosphate dehydratase [Candidatus Frackibacter sp. WG13]
MRSAEIKRQTSETDIKLNLDLDGEGRSQINTGVPFLNHMLDLFTKHGLFNLELEASGDLEIDAHHTVEDIGICLGKAINEAVGDKAGIKRYSTEYVPMDEALISVSLDLSGRAYLAYGLELTKERVGDFDTELVREFMRAVSYNGGITLHLRQLAGENTHHIIEAAFKALGRTLRQAVEKDDRIDGVMSTKGKL